MGLSPESALRQWHKRHLRRVDLDVRFLRLGTSARVLVFLQLFASVSCVLAAIVWEDVLFYAVIVLVWLLPKGYLAYLRAKRVGKFEEQLDGWLLTLANMLKATASLADAVRATVDLVRPPISEELDVVVKEGDLGTPFDQALRNMGDRIDSRLLSSALTTLLVGRQTGGELPKLLEESAAVLREMARLEGMVRAQTSQAKAQAYVLATIPAAFFIGFQLISPGFFEPLLQSATGYTIIGAAVFLWIGALYVGRKILNPDI